MAEFMTTVSGEFDVQCPLCKGNKKYNLKDEPSRPDAVDRIEIIMICPCCDGLGEVCVYVDADDVTVEIEP